MSEKKAEGGKEGAGLSAQTTGSQIPDLHSQLQYMIYMDVRGWGQWLDELASLYGRGVYKAVKRMERKGIVTRVADPENPKRTIICTPDAVKVWVKSDE